MSFCRTTLVRGFAISIVDGSISSTVLSTIISTLAEIPTSKIFFSVSTARLSDFVALAVGKE